MRTGIEQSPSEILLAYGAEAKVRGGAGATAAELRSV
jgi:hypothetical protein